VDNIVIGGVIVNGFLFALVAFFIQRWMNRVEADRKEDRDDVRRIAEEVSDRAEQTAKSVAEKTASTAEEIKVRIDGNRRFYETTFETNKEQYKEIKKEIEKLSKHMEVANGRTGKLEKDLAEQVLACKMRNANGFHG